MKKLLMTLATALLGFSAAQADEVWLEQSRSAWTMVGGCSQQSAHSANSTSDGGFADIIDDDINTYWHVSWAGAPNHDSEANHYFIINRGENPEPANGFRYLPKQSANGNGYVRKYAIYFVDEIPESVLNSTCTTETATLKESSHENMQEFLSSLTPAIDDEFDYTYSGDVSNHDERRAKFSEPQSGRYLIFVVKSSVGAESSTNSKVWANCADFKTFTVLEGTKVAFDSSNATTNGSLASNNNYTATGADDTAVSISCATGGTFITSGDSLVVAPGNVLDTWHTYKLQSTNDAYRIVYFKLTFGSYQSDNIKIKYNNGTEQSTEEGLVTIEGTGDMPMEFLATTTVNEHAKKGAIRSAEFLLQPVPLYPYKLNDRDGNTIATFQKPENWVPEWSSFATVSDSDPKVYVANNTCEDVYFYNYGSQKYIYARSAENATFNLGVKSSTDETSRFCLIKTNDDDDSYVLFSYSDGKFLSDLNGSSSTLGNTPAKCYYGRIPNEQFQFRSWFGLSTTASDNKFFNLNGGSTSSNIGGWKYQKDDGSYDEGSLMVVIRDINIFPENVAKETELLNALATAKAVVGADDNAGYDVEALQAAIDKAEAFDLGKDHDIQLVIDALNPELYEASAAEIMQQILDHAGLFTIQEATTEDSSLGYLGYSATEAGITTAEAPEEDNANYLWGFVEKDGKYYLYNAGAKQWANAWATATDALSVNDVAEYAWQLGVVPTEVNLSIAPFEKNNSAFEGTYRIIGGQNTKSNGAGMMVTPNSGTNTTYRVSVASKTTAENNGFKFTVKQETSSVKEEMAAKLDEAIAMAEKAVEDARGLEDASNGVVGHYASVDALYTELNKIDSETPIDKQYFLVQKGMAAIDTDDNRQEIIHENVYRIADSNGNHYYVNDGAQSTTEAEPEDNDLSHNWKATVEQDTRTVSFSHSYSDKTVHFTVGEAAEFTYDFTTTRGKVRLVPVNAAAVAAAMRAAEAADADGELTYVITKTTGDAVTTSISEVGADDCTDTVWYDLSGRRVAHPSNGIFINSRGQKHVFAN